MSPLVFLAYQEAMKPSMPIPMYGFCFMTSRRYSARAAPTTPSSYCAQSRYCAARGIAAEGPLDPVCDTLASGGTDEPNRGRADRVRVCVRRGARRHVAQRRVAA